MKISKLAIVAMGKIVFSESKRSAFCRIKKIEV